MGFIAEPFKNVFNPKMIALIAQHLKTAASEFDGGHFRKLAAKGLAKNELKQRSQQITAALESTLPGDFRKACSLMLAALAPESADTEFQPEIDHTGIRGWALMPMAEYVARQGQDDAEYSLEVLREFTKRFSSEFAVRPFLQAAPETALAEIKKWTRDPSVHVRRLASEGTRPRLPWGIRLTAFDANPQPLLPILEALKDDPEEYVRRSVANNLNDIAKVHPDLVAGIATKWLKDASPERKRLVRHACRTLIKQGHPLTLAAFGYTEPELEITAFTLDKQKVVLGDADRFICYSQIKIQSAAATRDRLHHPPPEGEWRHCAESVQMENCHASCRG